MALMGFPRLCSDTPTPMLLGLLRSARTAKSLRCQPSGSHLAEIWSEHVHRSLSAQATGLMPMTWDAPRPPSVTPCHPRSRLTTLAIPAVSAGASEISQSTNVQSAVEACCLRLGRPVGSAEQQLVRNIILLPLLCLSQLSQRSSTHPHHIGKSLMPVRIYETDS